MKIYYSIYDTIEKLKKFNFTQPNIATGWGKFIEFTRAFMREYGFEIVESAEDADIELFTGQPPLKLKPSMIPNAMFTMYESTQLPQSWVDGMNHWDCIITPSDWGCSCFIDGGVETEVIKVPLWVDENFEFVERDINGQWVYLAMAVQLTDRKNSKLVVDIFREDFMPNDSLLLAKTTTTYGNSVEWDLWAHHNINLIQADFSHEDLIALIQKSHVSVNPSSGEGFGWIPAEAMRTGACTIINNFSASSELLREGYNISLKCDRVLSHYSGLKGYIGVPDEKDLLKQMLWTYNNREEAMEMGRLSSQWIKEEFSVMRFCQRLEQELTRLIKSKEKRILNQDPGYIYKEIAFDKIQAMENAR